jgi:hypothetical protein
MLLFEIRIRSHSLRANAPSACVEMRHHPQGGLAFDAVGQAIGMAVLGPRRVIVIPMSARCLKNSTPPDARMRWPPPRGAASLICNL